jgi:hypothetical protein
VRDELSCLDSIDDVMRQVLDAMHITADDTATPSGALMSKYPRKRWHSHAQ